MPIVFTFWQLPEEESDFIDFVQNTGEIVAIPTRPVRTKEEMNPEPIKDFITKQDPSELKFGLKQLFSNSEIIRKDFNGELLYTVDGMRPCLIHYTRPRFWNGKLGRSNLAAYTDYPNVEATALIKKSPEFIKWTKKVVAWMRKRARAKIELNGFKYPATEKSKEAFIQRKFEACL